MTKKILITFNTVDPKPIDYDYSEELKTKDWETEKNVIQAIKKLGEPYECLGLFDDISLLQTKINSFKPDVVFNLVERFKNDTSLDQNIPSILELLGVSYTGCGPLGLSICKNKGLSKKILSYHRIPVPDFAIFPKNKKVRRPKRLDFPIFIKPLNEEASLGIAQSSFVENDQQFNERVQFIHEKMDQDVIAEEYIEGRELYVSILGNRRLKIFPVRELKFREVPTDEPKFASYKAKWDESYRKKWGIKNEFADTLPQGMQEKIIKFCKKTYHLLHIQGYARLDLRLTADGRIVFIEANPNPMLSKEEDFAESANKGGLPYPELIKKIIELGIHTNHST